MRPDRGQTAAADQFWPSDRRRLKNMRCTPLAAARMSVMKCGQASFDNSGGAPGGGQGGEAHRKMFEKCLLLWVVLNTSNYK